MRAGGATRPGPAPGRGPKVRSAVLAATLSELTETGYAAMTIENVAQRAGVHKTTVYRRWQSRERLVADAVTELAGTRVPSRIQTTSVQTSERSRDHWSDSWPAPSARPSPP